MTQFPYENRFRHYLDYDRNVENNTREDICRDVSNLFKHLRSFNAIYRENPNLSKLSSSDIRDYLNMLQVRKNIKNSTYNKHLTHLNVYFSFLFDQRLSSSLPTLPLRGLKRSNEILIPLTWAEDIHIFLKNDKLSYYTRMLLLLLKHYYPISQVLQPGFYGILTTEAFDSQEQLFIAEFNNHMDSLRKKQNSRDLFLKSRVNFADPLLSLPGLHRYLKKDQQYCHIALVPRKLYQAVIFNAILTKQNLTDQQLATELHLDLTSLAYYRQELLKLDIPFK